MACTQTKAYHELLKAKHLTPIPPKPLPSPLPPTFNPVLTCEYHSEGQGHDTESCFSLRHKIQDLIDNKVINTQEAQPPSAPNVNTNPLTNHAINLITGEEVVRGGIIVTEDYEEESTTDDDDLEDFWPPCPVYRYDSDREQDYPEWALESVGDNFSSNGWGKEFLHPRYTEAEHCLAEELFNREDMTWGFEQPRIPAAPFKFSEGDLDSFFAEIDQGEAEKEKAAKEQSLAVENQPNPKPQEEKTDPKKETMDQEELQVPKDHPDIKHQAAYNEIKEETYNCTISTNPSQAATNASIRPAGPNEEVGDWCVEGAIVVPKPT